MTKCENDIIRLKGNIVYSGSRTSTPMNFVEPTLFDDLSGYIDLIVSIDRGYIAESEKEFYKKLLSGEEMIVTNNVLHVKSPKAFVKYDKEYVKKEMVHLLDGNNYSPSPDFLILPDSDSIAIEKISSVTGVGSFEVFEYDCVFTTRARYRASFDKAWNPQLYKSSRSLGRCWDPKLLWDMLNYGDKIMVDNNSFMDLVCLKPYTVKEQLRYLGRHAMTDFRYEFTSSVSLLAEFLFDGKYREIIEKLEECRKVKEDDAEERYFNGKDFFSGPVFTRSPKEIDQKIIYAKIMFEGLQASKILLEKFRAIESRLNADSNLALGTIIAQKICLDPAMYVDDRRKYIADFAGRIIGGMIDVAELPD